VVNLWSNFNSKSIEMPNTNTSTATKRTNRNNQSARVLAKINTEKSTKMDIKSKGWSVIGSHHHHHQLDLQKTRRFFFFFFSSTQRPISRVHRLVYGMGQSAHRHRISSNMITE